MSRKRLAVVVGLAVLVALLWVLPAVAREPLKPFHVVLNVDADRWLVGRTGYASRAECEGVLGATLCDATGWEI